MHSNPIGPTGAATESPSSIPANSTESMPHPQNENGRQVALAAESKPNRKDWVQASLRLVAAALPRSMATS